MTLLSFVISSCGSENAIEAGLSGNCVEDC